MKNSLIEYLKVHKRDIINYLIVFCLSLVYFFRILDSDAFYYAHDLVFHASNIITVASELSLTNLLPDKIMPILVNNLGYGVNIFYPVFPHLVGAYLYKIIGDIPLTFKLLSLIIINLSGFTMYKFVDKVFKNKQQALLSAITYISMPYFFSEFFIRCALNESFLFFIMPMILLSIHYLIDDNNIIRFYLLFVIGYVLAINSHLVMSIYLTIVLGIYLLIQYKKVFKWDVIKHFLIASIFILGLTAFFTVPLLEHNYLGIYNILNIEYVGNRSVQITNTFNYLLPIKHLDIPMYIPPLITLVLVYVFIKMDKVSKKYKTSLIGMYIVLIFSIFMATNVGIWNFMPNIIRNIQFGWRMSLFIVLSVSIIFGYSLNLFKKDFRKIFLINFICIYAITNAINSGLIVKEKVKNEGYLNTTEEKVWGQEYLPVDSVRNILEVKSKKTNLVNVNTDAIIEIIENDVPDMEFRVDNLSEELVLEFPRIYYLGYKLTDDAGKDYELGMNNFGFIESTISEDGTYYLEYTGTRLDNVSYVISIVSSLLFLFYLIILKYNKKRGGKDGFKQQKITKSR